MHLLVQKFHHVKVEMQYTHQPHQSICIYSKTVLEFLQK